MAILDALFSRPPRTSNPGCDNHDLRAGDDAVGVPARGGEAQRPARQAIDLVAALLAEAGVDRRVATLSSWPLT